MVNTRAPGPDHACPAGSWGPAIAPSRGGGGSTPIGGARGAPAAKGKAARWRGWWRRAARRRGVSKGGSEAAYARRQCGGGQRGAGYRQAGTESGSPAAWRGAGSTAAGGATTQWGQRRGGGGESAATRKPRSRRRWPDPKRRVPSPDHGPTAGQGDPWGSERPRDFRDHLARETEDAPRAEAARRGGPHRRERPSLNRRHLEACQNCCKA